MKLSSVDNMYNSRSRISNNNNNKWRWRHRETETGKCFHFRCVVISLQLAHIHLLQCTIVMSVKEAYDTFNENETRQRQREQRKHKYTNRTQNTGDVTRENEESIKLYLTPKVVVVFFPPFICFFWIFHYANDGLNLSIIFTLVPIQLHHAYLIKWGNSFSFIRATICVCNTHKHTHALYLFFSTVYYLCSYR